LYLLAQCLYKMNQIEIGEMDGEKIVRLETSFDRMEKALHDTVREDVHLCEVCEKPTNFYCIEGNDGDEFWYCEDHAKTPVDGDFINDNLMDR
jgi:hypothetical protein